MLIVFLKIVKALRDVFRRGVLHRDIKESNIIIRADDGEPVLIDFGFSAVVGALTETVPGLVPPGTPEYRSPEAMSFLAGKTQEDTYEYSLADELWAVGVTLYWLLTDEMPFGNREDLGLNARVRLETPQAPHVINPRVTAALRALRRDAVAEREGSARHGLRGGGTALDDVVGARKSRGRCSSAGPCYGFTLGMPRALRQ